MCTGTPMKVVQLCANNLALVELDGLKKEISIALTPDVRVGEYVIVHVGHAIEVLDVEAAESTLRLMAELAEAPFLPCESSGQRPAQH